MNKVTVIGIDLAKNVFQLSSLNNRQKQLLNRRFNRQGLMTYMAQHPACEVGLEACGSAHYWGRKFTDMGHRVKLLPPAYVKGLVYGNKNDVNDAKAIALAAAQDESPTVAIKSSDQLALQALMRIRQRRVEQRKRCANQIRGLLYEHGVVMKTGIGEIRHIVVETLPIEIRSLIGELVEEFTALSEYVKTSQHQVDRLVKSHPIGQRLLTIPGFGVLNSLAALIVNPADFHNGRHYAAYLGLVPKQSGTGGKVRIGGMSKRGNRYHRQLICHGARSFLCRSRNHRDPLWQWARHIQLKKGTNLAVGALANKLCRISWRVLNDPNGYDSRLSVSPR